MKVWFLGFILLFGAAEFLQWMKQFSLPLPIFILGGAFLAVASNYDKLTLPFDADSDRPEPIAQAVQNPVQPPQALKNQPDRSISFTVSQRDQPKD